MNTIKVEYRKMKYKKCVVKFECVGTNSCGDITTYYTESGKSLGKLLAVQVMTGRLIQ